jgi:hypothetical protein
MPENISGLSCATMNFDSIRTRLTEGEPPPAISTSDE